MYCASIMFPLTKTNATNIKVGLYARQEKQQQGIFARHRVRARTDMAISRLADLPCGDFAKPVSQRRNQRLPLADACSSERGFWLLILPGSADGNLVSGKYLLIEADGGAHSSVGRATGS